MELNKVISDFNEKHKLESIRVEFSFLKNGIPMYTITDGKISLYAMAMRGTKPWETRRKIDTAMTKLEVK